MVTYSSYSSFSAHLFGKLTITPNRHKTRLPKKHDGCPRFAKAYLGRKRWATRISCHGAPPTPTCAAFVKESRMKFANANKLVRKSWGSPPLLSLHGPTEPRPQIV